MTDKACQGKAILVTTGAGIVVRNLTLTRARVPDFNGAGIRAEGSSLTVDHVHFINNQDGILTGAPEGSTLTVRDSEFLRNGGCDGACAHGIYAGHIALLHVEHTRFFETKEAHNIKSRALRTEVIGCDIADGAEGTSSYQVEIPNGGSVVVRDSTMEKGPKSGNHTAAIMIGSEGVTQPTREITIDNNTFRNDGDYQTTFVVNLTATEAQLKGNHFSGPVKPLRGDGQVN
jgi:pectate lyase